MTYLLWRLTARNLKVFFKEKANVFFALLAPLIVLALYVLFLGRIQIDGILAALGDGASAAAETAVQSFCNSWMLAGALSCACITVPLCACGVMVTDKTRGITSDFLASPVPRWVPAASYFVSVVLAGLAIGGAVLGVCFVWLAASGSWYLSAADVFGCIGTVILSVLSSSAFLTFIIGFIRTQGAFMGVNVIFGTVIGFLIGAYMPIGYFPLGVQYFTLFIPGSWSAGMFRNFIMRGALEEVARATSQPFADALGGEFSMTLNGFGTELGLPVMAAVLAGSVVLFAALALLAARLKKRRSVRAGTIEQHAGTIEQHAGKKEKKEQEGTEK